MGYYITKEAERIFNPIWEIVEKTEEKTKITCFPGKPSIQMSEVISTPELALPEGIISIITVSRFIDTV